MADNNNSNRKTVQYGAEIPAAVAYRFKKYIVGFVRHRVLTGAILRIAGMDRPNRQPCLERAVAEMHDMRRKKLVYTTVSMPVRLLEEYPDIRRYRRLWLMAAMLELMSRPGLSGCSWATGFLNAWEAGLVTDGNGVLQARDTSPLNASGDSHGSDFVDAMTRIFGSDEASLKKYITNEPPPHEPCRYIPDNCPCKVEVWPIVWNDHDGRVDAMVYDPCGDDDHLIVMKSGLTEERWMQLIDGCVKLAGVLMIPRSGSGGGVCPFCGKGYKVNGCLRSHTLRCVPDRLGIGHALRIDRDRCCKRQIEGDQWYYRRDKDDDGSGGVL